MWWNITYQAQSPRESGLIVHVDLAHVQNLKPAHEIHLANNAQIYSVVVGKDVLVICQNDAIMSFYSCKYGSIEDEVKAVESSEESKREDKS